VRPGHVLGGRHGVRRGVDVRRVRAGALPRRGERGPEREPVRAGLLLRRLDAGKHGAKCVPRGVLLCCGPGNRNCEPLPRGQVLARRHFFHVPCLLPSLRSRLLLGAWQHGEHGKPLHCGLLLHQCNGEHHPEPLRGGLLLPAGRWLSNVVPRRQLLPRQQLTACRLPRALLLRPWRGQQLRV
jgi:hypothetical protein